MKKAANLPIVIIPTLGILAILIFGNRMNCSDKHDARDDPAAPTKSALSQPRRMVSFKTSDGWTITGDLFTPQDKPIGAVVLLHQRGGSATDWHDLCDELRTKGIVALAIDQRGNGRSLSQDPRQNKDNAPWDTSNDVSAAIAWLIANFGDKKHGPDELGIGLVGASYGANNALIYAAAHKDATRAGSVKSIVLFSPGVNYNGLKTEEPAKLWTGPIAIFYAEYDKIAGLGPTQIRDTSPSHDKVTQQFDGDSHGTELLSDDTISDTVVFLARTLQ